MIFPRRMRKAVDVPGRTRQVADRLADGRLPKIAPVASRARFGSGAICDGCGAAILPRDVEQEHDVRGGATLRLHAVCAAIWERMIAPPNP